MWCEINCPRASPSPLLIYCGDLEVVCDAILAALRTVCASQRQGGAVVVLALKRNVNNLQQVNPLDFTGETERIRGIYSFTCTEHQQN